MTTNSPFSPKRARDDLVAALPAIGMVVGAVVGAAVGATQGVGGPVAGGGLGIAAGLGLGAAGRLLLHKERP